MSYLDICEKKKKIDLKFQNSLKDNVDSTVLSFDQNSSKRKEWLNQKKSNNAFLKSEQDFLKRQYGSNCIVFLTKIYYK